MSSDQHMLKRPAQFSLVLLAVLCLLGLVFWRERLFFSDSAFIAFNIIKYHSFYIQEHRYGSFITQMVPMLAQKMHLSIGVCLKAYTLSFNVFYLLVGIVVYRCRQYGMVLLMTLYYSLFVSASWFWTNNEIHQALAWMFLMFALLFRMCDKGVKGYWLYAVAATLGFVAIYTHFLVLIPLVFFWVYMWSWGKVWPFNKQQSIVVSLIFVGIVVSKFLVVSDNSYDEGHLHNVTHLSLKDFKWAFTAGVLQAFWERCPVLYPSAIVVTLAGVYSLIRQKMRLQLFLMLGGIVCYVFLMGVTYGPKGYDIVLFHIETEWQSLAIIIGIPFVFSFLPGIKNVWADGLLSAMFLFLLLNITLASGPFIERIKFKQSVLARMRLRGYTKLAIEPDSVLNKKASPVWCLPDESMLMSACEGDQPQLSYIILEKDDTNTLKLLGDPKTTIMGFEASKPDSWDYKYLHPDTLAGYHILSYREFIR